MIALNRSGFKKEELLFAGLSYFSFGFYIVFTNVLSSIIKLIIYGKPSPFYFFGSYCFSGERLMDISKLPLNEKSILPYSIFLIIKISLLVGGILWFNKALQKVGYATAVILFFSLFSIDTISLLVFYLDKFTQTSFFWYFFTSAPVYLLSKELSLSIVLPVLLACLGIALPVYVLKRLGIYSLNTVLLSFASLFLGVISVVIFFEVLQKVSRFLI